MNSARSRTKKSPRKKWFSKRLLSLHSLKSRAETVMGPKQQGTFISEGRSPSEIYRSMSVPENKVTKEYSSSSLSSGSTYEEWLTRRKSAPVRSKTIKHDRVISFNLRRNHKYNEYEYINSKVNRDIDNVVKVASISGAKRKQVRKSMIYGHTSQKINKDPYEDSSEESSFSLCLAGDDDNDMEDALKRPGQDCTCGKFLFVEDMFSVETGPFGEKRVSEDVINLNTLDISDTVIQRARNTRFTGNNITVWDASDCVFEGSCVFVMGDQNTFKGDLSIVVGNHNTLITKYYIVNGKINRDADGKHIYGQDNTIMDKLCDIKKRNGQKSPQDPIEAHK